MSIQETNLKAIADAIRAKTGETGTIKASEFASKIAAISTGVAEAEWVLSTLPTSTEWRSVCYGDGKFVAVSCSNISAYSTDGINWIQATMPETKNWSSVCYGNGKFVAVAYDSDIAAYSTDGINWTQTTMPETRVWASVCYGDGKFVAVTRNSDIAAYIKDYFNSWA